MLRDIRYAVRSFLRAPGFAITVIATIGVALGLNTTLFTVFNAYVLRPLAVHDPYSLYQVLWTTKSGSRNVAWTEFREIQKQKQVLAATLAFENAITRVNGQQLIGQRVTTNYFSTLGVDAAIGRVLLDGDDQVAVLSYGAWISKFGADPNIVGKKLVMFGRSYEIAGVARREFAGLDVLPPDFWIPLLDSPQNILKVIVRLDPGVSSSQAEAALAGWAREVTAGVPEPQRATGIQLDSRAASMPINAESIAMFAPIVVAFGLVLVIACANVANMMLARAMARQREIGVRLSLGAGRARLIWQLLTECLILALPAGLLGFAVSRATIRLAQSLFFAFAPPMFNKMVRFADLSPDLRVFSYILAAVVAAAVLFGLVPAIQATRGGLHTVARGDFSHFRPARLRNALVISQVTVCALLLICSGILLRGSRQIERSNSGLVTRDIVQIEIQEKIPGRLIDQLSSEPWVDSVATAMRAPLSGSPRGILVAPGDDASRIRAPYNYVSPEYFGVFRLAIIRGRNFTADEANSEAPVVIISEATARAFWPRQDALGQPISIAPDQRNAKTPAFRTARVIGITRDVINGLLWDGPDPAYLYFPAQAKGLQGGAVLVRVKSGSSVARRALDDVLARTSPAGVRQVNMMDDLLATQVFPFQISFAIAAFLGGLALALTLSGIYGVLSYVVTQRRKEIGIRMALGATRANVIRLVLSQSFRLAAYGIAIGSVFALAISKLVASLVVAVNTFDVLAYGGGILVVLGAAIAASFFPTRRAVRVDPASTLRYD